jgi:hypothetical protein
MTPEALSALAARFRGYAGTIRNPEAKAGLVADLNAGAQVIDDLLKLYADIQAGEHHDVARAVRALVGEAAVLISLALPQAEAQALAVLCRYLDRDAVRELAALSPDEADVTASAVTILLGALAGAGFAPR